MSENDSLSFCQPFCVFMKNKYIFNQFIKISSQNTVCIFVIQYFGVYRESKIYLIHFKNGF